MLGQRSAGQEREGGGGRAIAAAHSAFARALLFARTHWPGLLLLIGAGALYVATLQDGLQLYQLQGGDLITHQYAQAQGRFSNAPGYPLYTMGGWLWLHGLRLLLGPDANPVSILSAYSTLWALLALWLFYLLALEVTNRAPAAAPGGPTGGTTGASRGNRLAAALAGGFYAVTYFFWFYSVTTEQYTSAVAWTLAAAWLAFRWDRTRCDRYLLWLAFLAGVALAHMLTLALALPPLLALILLREPRLLRRPRLIGAVLGLAALPLLSYLYIYVRGAQHPEWWGAGQWRSTWAWFWNFLSTSQGRSELTLSLTPFFTAEFPGLIWRELTWPGLAAGLLGLALLPRRRGLALYGIMLIYLVFCWIDRLGNWFQVIMPVYALVAVGIAIAADFVLRRSGGAEEQGGAKLGAAPRLLHSLVFAALAGLILYRGLASYPEANMRRRAEATALDPGWAILADDPPAGAAILGTQPEVLALNYIMAVWDRRPDLQSVSADEARSLLDGPVPLAVTRAFLPLAPAELNASLRYSALGRTMVAVGTRPNDRPATGLVSWNEDFGAGLRLAGGRLVHHSSATGEATLLLSWQALAAPSGDFSVSVRLLKGGAEIGQSDFANPVFGAYPTSRWLPGEVVGDAHGFHLSPGAAPDAARVILYSVGPDGAFVNLHVADLALP